MAKKILQIVESAYRGTLEEQDDTVIWLTHAMKGAGGDFRVLLRGNAVNYAVRGQDASGLSFGEKRQTQPPQVAEDLVKLAGKGVELLFVEEDADERGIDKGQLIEGVRPVKRTGVAQLIEGHDQIWHW